MDKDISVILDSNVTLDQRQEFFSFEEKCFDENLKESRNLLYFSQPYAHILLRENNRLIAYLRIFIRKITWEEKRIILGGIGSVSTDLNYRGKGLATKLLKKAVEIFQQQDVDFALLQTDIAKGGKLYGRIGFSPANKPYTFYDSRRQLRMTKAKDVMVAPMRNPTILNEILHSKTLLHIGSGDW